MSSYTLMRTARHQWTCAKCGQPILADTQYKDHGYQKPDNHWYHVRTHLMCPTEEYPIPVQLKNGTKEWLLGKVHNMQGEPVFLTRDWGSPHKYHFRVQVYDETMQRL
jgi:hypothetical protein